MTLEIRSAAEQDIVDAVSFYLEEKTPLSAARFLEAVEAGYDAILSAPKRYRINEHGVRELPLAKFPFSIHFVDEHDRIIVLAIRHHKRAPQGTY